MTSHLPPLLYLTDPTRSPDLAATASALPAGTAVIYRHFGAGDRYAMAHTLRRITALRRVKLLIANDPSLARAIGADGLHWPEASIAGAKYWRDRFSLMTASAHSRAALHTASTSFVDAALVSTVFPSSSPSATSPMGTIRFRAMAKSTPLPVYALGGVTGQNAHSIAPAGGIASISGVEAAFGA